jgi:hypothetical protein
MQAKLVKFEKKLNQQGQHDTYTGQHGTLYKFYVTFDNGTTGEANAKSEVPTWKLNEEYIFEVAVNGSFTNIKGMKSANQSYGGKKDYKPDPSFLFQKCFEAACEVTIDFFGVIGEWSSEKETLLLNKIWTFILNGDDNRKWINISAMRLAVRKLEKCIINPTSATLFEQAKAIADNMSNTVKQTVDATQSNTN